MCVLDAQEQMRKNLYNRMTEFTFLVDFITVITKSKRENDQYIYLKTLFSGSADKTQDHVCGFLGDKLRQSELLSFPKISFASPFVYKCLWLLYFINQKYYD